VTRGHIPDRTVAPMHCTGLYFLYTKITEYRFGYFWWCRFMLRQRTLHLSLVNVLRILHCGQTAELILEVDFQSITHTKK